MNKFVKKGIGLAVAVGMIAGVFGMASADPPVNAGSQQGIVAHQDCNESSMQSRLGYSGNNNSETRGLSFRFAGLPDAVQTLLGMTEEQIEVARNAGQSLSQIAVQQNVSETALIQTILAERKKIVDAKVAEGRITQEQADLIIENMEKDIAAIVQRVEHGSYSAEKSPAYGMAFRSQDGTGNGLYKGQMSPENRMNKNQYSESGEIGKLNKYQYSESKGYQNQNPTAKGRFAR